MAITGLTWCRGRTPTACASGGSPNDLAVRAIGDRLTFMVNETEVASVQDDTLVAGRRGRVRRRRLQRGRPGPICGPGSRLIQRWVPELDSVFAAQPLTRRAFLAIGAVAVGTVGGLAGIMGASSREQPAADQRIPLGDLTLVVRADPWRLSLLGPSGQVVWDEAADQTLGYQTVGGQMYRARRLASFGTLGDGAVQLIAQTDDPAGGALVVEARVVGPRAFRLTVIPDTTSRVGAIGGAFMSPADERFVGFGERFDGVNQRGRSVEMWAEDRRVADYGPSTYAPIPVLLSSRGHGFALERFERSRFDLAARSPDRWAWQQDAPAVSILVTYGPTLKDLVQRNAEVTVCRRFRRHGCLGSGRRQSVARSR